MNENIQTGTDSPSDQGLESTNNPVSIPGATSSQLPQNESMPSQVNVPAEAVQPIVDNKALFDQIVEKIIEQQESIIGPVAVEQAKKVHELKINWPQHDVGIEGNPQIAIDELVEQYKELFGQIAVQVSKETVAAIMAQLPLDQQPKSLQ